MRRRLGFTRQMANETNSVNVTWAIPAVAAIIAALVGVLGTVLFQGSSFIGRAEHVEFSQRLEARAVSIESHIASLEREIATIQARIEDVKHQVDDRFVDLQRQQQGRK